MMRKRSRQFSNCMVILTVAFLTSSGWAQSRAAQMGATSDKSTQKEVAIDTALGQMTFRIDPTRERVVLNDLGMPVLKRVPLKKVADDELTLMPWSTGRLIVKFVDDARVRLNQRKIASTVAPFAAGMTQIDQLISQYGLSVRPLLEKSEAAQQRIADRARMMSGHPQPDTAGMYYIEGDRVSTAQFEAVARALNQRPEVEFVSFEREHASAQGGPTGACCVPIVDAADNCVVDCMPSDSDGCEAMGGFFQGTGSVCGGLPGCDPTYGACCVGDECRTLALGACLSVGGVYLECSGGGPRNCENVDLSCETPDCGEPSAGGCFVAKLTPFCELEDCCEQVCAIDPFCCDEDLEDIDRGRGMGRWDSTCVWIASNLSGTDDDPTFSCGSDVCGAGGINDCDTATPMSPGCNDYGCCATVCSMDPDCCMVTWDSDCVTIAGMYCLQPTSSGSPVPNFSQAQGYLTFESTFSPDPPAEVFTDLPRNRETGGPLVGYDGTGLDIQGMVDFAQFLLDEYDVGDSNGALGAGTRVAVVDRSANIDHIEFEGRIQSEPGHTVLIIPGSATLDGNHGTAVLATAGATDHGAPGMGDEIGVIGVAPQSELFFFPSVSLENPGGRLFNAISNSFDVLEIGDVLAIPLVQLVSTECVEPITNEPAIAMLLQQAADLGIVSCVAAGNTDCEIDAPDIGGVMVVGAVTPGVPFCRHDNSNYATVGGVIDVAGWGDHVVTAGFGDLYDNGNTNEWYTNSFSGTSAATAMISGLVARYQGFAKQFYGQFLTATQISSFISRDLLGFEACNDYGNDEGNNDLGDYNPGAIDFGVFPIPSVGAEQMLVERLFDNNPYVDSIEIIRGDYVFGHDISILETDGNFFVVESEYTPRGTQSVDSDKSPANRVTYVAAGETVDVLVYAHAFFSGTVSNLQVQTQVGTSTGAAIAVIELWDWTRNRWSFVGFTTIGAGSQVFNASTPQGQRFINNDRQVVIRLYATSPGGPSVDVAGNSVGAIPFALLIDRVALDALDFTFGFTPGPGSFGTLPNASPGGVSSLP